MSIRLITLDELRCLHDGAEKGLPNQRRRFALLVYLAMERSAPREKVAALFNPDVDEEHARHRLKQNIFEIRQALGRDCIETRGDEIGATDALSVDARDFGSLAEAGDFASALKLYRRPFLDGFYLEDTGAFERWAERKRAILARTHVHAARSWVSKLIDRQEYTEAIDQATRWLELDENNDDAHALLMTALARAGRRVEALNHYDALAERVRSERGTTPVHSLRVLAEQLRNTTPLITSGSRGAPPTPEAKAEEAQRATVSASTIRRRKRVWLGLISTAAVLATIIAVLNAAAHDPEPVLAVGDISESPAEDSVRLGLVTRGLLRAKLEHIRNVAVLTEARLAELRFAEENSGTDDLAEKAARRAGATDLFTGVLYRIRGDSLRLELQHLDLERNRQREPLSVTGRDLVQVTTIAADRIARRMNRELRAEPVAASTTSLAAWRLHEQGLRALYTGNPEGAADLFEAALKEDPTFAMAAYQASRVALWRSKFADRAEPLRRAVRLSKYATDRERLLISAEWAEVRNDTSWLAVAETLAKRYPHEPDGAYQLGRALSWRGEFDKARTVLLDVARRDSASLRHPEQSSWWCRACDALREAIMAAWSADSLAAAERTARWWLNVDSASAAARNMLAKTLEYRGLVAEALAEQQLSWNTPGIDDSPYRIELAIRVGDYSTSDTLLAHRAADLRSEEREQAYWWQTISLRQQGRLQEALYTAQRYRAAVRKRSDERGALRSAAQEHQVLFAMGKLAEAVALSDSMLDIRSHDRKGIGDEDWSGGLARDHAWSMAHVAELVAAAGDSVRLSRLCDSLEVVGSRTSYVRDRGLLHHARGLLLLARHDTTGAIRELRAGIGSPTMGYTRTNYVLGRVLTSQGRASEAIAILEPALRGGLESSNLYVTRTELHEALGDAYLMAGQKEKARTAFMAVANSWARADSTYRVRAQRAARLARGKSN